MAEVVEAQDAEDANPNAANSAPTALPDAAADAVAAGVLLGGAGAAPTLHDALHGADASLAHGAGRTVQPPPGTRGLLAHGVGAVTTLHDAALATATAQAARTEDFFHLGMPPWTHSPTLAAANTQAARNGDVYQLGMPPWTPTGAGAEGTNLAPQGAGAEGAEARTATAPFPAPPPLSSNMEQPGSALAATLVAARAAATEGQTCVRVATLV